MSNVAADVRRSKERNPELYCADPRCLWRIVTSRGPNPCRNHPHLNKPATSETPSTDATPSLSTGL